MSDPTERSAREMGRLRSGLESQQQRILANWLVNVSTMPVYRATPSFSRDDLSKGIPELVEMAMAVVTTGYLDATEPPVEEANALAQEHGRRRRREGFGVGVPLAELQTLRREFWLATFRELETAQPTVESLRDLQQRIGRTFDALVVAAAEGWVAEDAQAR